MTFRPWLAALALALPLSAQAKVIRDPNEYKAYAAALEASDPAGRTAALESFLARYPFSTARREALEQVMRIYQQSGNAAGMKETARRLLVLDPDHVGALAVTTYLGRLEATAGGAKAVAGLEDQARRGLQALARWTKPEGMADAEYLATRSRMAHVFHGSLGFAALSAGRHGEARLAFRQALQEDPADAQDRYQLAVADLEGSPLDPEGFWHAARAMALARNAGDAKVEASIRAYAAGRYEAYHGSLEGFDRIAQQAAGQTEPPPDFARSVSPAPGPAALAVQVVRDHKAAELSFADWEYVLGFRDASPGNRAAADEVWAALQALQEGGAVRLRFPARVVAQSGSLVELAITEANRKAGTADLHARLAQAPARALVPGEPVEVAGRFTGYVPQPFHFEMDAAELFLP
jgi:tetratricopeptide (TPR) repeat protein